MIFNYFESKIKTNAHEIRILKKILLLRCRWIGSKSSSPSQLTQRRVEPISMTAKKHDLLSYYISVATLLCSQRKWPYLQTDAQLLGRLEPWLDPRERGCRSAPLGRCTLPPATHSPLIYSTLGKAKVKNSEDVAELSCKHKKRKDQPDKIHWKWALSIVPFNRT